MIRRRIAPAVAPLMPEDFDGLIFDLNPNAPNVLFSDDAGTPAQVDGTVHVFTELVDGHSLLQASAARRPTVKESSTGYKYLETDGGDGMNSTPVASMAHLVDSNISVVAWSREEIDPGAGVARIFGLMPGDATTNGVHQIITNYNSGNIARLFRRYDTGDAARTLQVLKSAWPQNERIIQTAYVYEGNGSWAYRGYLDGAYFGQATNTTANKDCTSVAILANHTSGGDYLPAGGKLFRVCIFARKLSSADLLSMRIAMSEAIGTV